MPSLNAFIESLAKEHDKLVKMGSLRSSKDQALFVGKPKATDAKVKINKKENTKFDHPEQKEKTGKSNEPSCSKKDKQRGKEKTRCS